MQKKTKKNTVMKTSIFLLLLSWTAISFCQGQSTNIIIQQTQLDSLWKSGIGHYSFINQAEYVILKNKGYERDTTNQQRHLFSHETEGLKYWIYPATNQTRNFTWTFQGKEEGDISTGPTTLILPPNMILIFKKGPLDFADGSERSYWTVAISEQ